MLRRVVCAVLLLLTSVHVALTLHYGQCVAEEYDAMMNRYQQSPDGITYWKQVDVPKVVFPYVKTPDDFEYKMIGFEHGKPVNVSSAD